MPPSSCSPCPRRWFCSILGGLSGTWFLLFSLSLSPKLEAISVMHTGEQWWGERGHKQVDVVVSFPRKWHGAAKLWQIYPYRVLWQIYRCLHSVTEGEPQMKALQEEHKALLEYHCFFWGANGTCTCLHLLLFFVTTIATLILFSSSSLHCSPRSFYFHWIFYNFHLSSGKLLSCVFSYWVSAEGSEGCSLHMDIARAASVCYGSVVINTNLLHPPTELLSLQCSQFPWHAFASRRGPYIGAQLMGV